MAKLLNKYTIKKIMVILILLVLFLLLFVAPVDASNQNKAKNHNPFNVKEIVKYFYNQK